MHAWAQKIYTRLRPWEWVLRPPLPYMKVNTRGPPSPWKCGRLSLPLLSLFPPLSSLKGKAHSLQKVSSLSSLVGAPSQVAGSFQWPPLFSFLCVKTSLVHYLGPMRFCLTSPPSSMPFLEAPLRYFPPRINSPINKKGNACDWSMWKRRGTLMIDYHPPLTHYPTSPLEPFYARLK